MKIHIPYEKDVLIAASNRLKERADDIEDVLDVVIEIFKKYTNENFSVDEKLAEERHLTIEELAELPNHDDLVDRCLQENFSNLKRDIVLAGITEEEFYSIIAEAMDYI